jgi:hypothetical protein
MSTEMRAACLYTPGEPLRIDRITIVVNPDR